MNLIKKYKPLIIIIVIMLISTISFQLMKSHIDYWRYGFASFYHNHSNLTIITLPTFTISINLDKNSEQLIYDKDGLEIFVTIIPDNDLILLRLKSIDTSLSYNIARRIETDNYADYLVNREHNLYGCFYYSGPSNRLGHELGFRILEKLTLDEIEIEIRDLQIYTYERY